MAPTQAVRTTVEELRQGKEDQYHSQGYYISLNLPLLVCVHACNPLNEDMWSFLCMSLRECMVLNVYNDHVSVNLRGLSVLSLVSILEPPTMLQKGVTSNIPELPFS